MVATVVWAQRSLLDSRIDRMFKDFDIKESVESIDITPSVKTETEDATPKEEATPLADGENVESIGDPVDWTQKPESIGDDTNWEEEIELID